ncbi:SRPBCC family protein [Paenibacillus bouchesdurhonensis]|uniref:SRPBCC family protein n=1 Tax=Paenibacillus bouchesdurhonensis TaxID=1870990 RepID=UPI000DA5EBF4|nr:SRPBCC family protein [Paenibacillus bouchesdurhonensis]
MIADIRQADEVYIARFERRLKHPIQEVWSWLTENDKLAEWFPELRIDDLREGGAVIFDMQDGTFEELRIIELQPGSVLEYVWGEDLVRFELYPESEGCHLVFIEKLHQITDHTPKDLAGWHVCLDVIQKLMDGQTVEARHEEWKIWYEKYTQMLLK